MSMIKTWLSSPKSMPTWVPPSDGMERDYQQSDVSRSISRRPSPASSRLSNASSARSSTTVREGPFTLFERSEAVTRRKLQSLIDAQAEGLLASSGGQSQAPHHQSKSESATSVRSLLPGTDKVVPVRQPVKKPMSLRLARHGITTSMLELSETKSRELEQCVAELAENELKYEAALSFETRHAQLLGEMQQVEKAGDTPEKELLQAKDNALVEQIDAAEIELARLKDERRFVQAQLSNIANSVDSKMSSYKESVRLLERDMSSFLQASPIVSEPARVSYLSLPPKRRTVQMAREHALSQKESLQARRKRVKEEQEALEEGLTIWQDTLSTVSTFESTLKAGIARLGADAPGREVDHGRDMADLLQSMDNVIDDLDSKVRLADTRGWKLLVCCIGAELEAFRQGRDMLQSAAGGPESSDDQWNGVHEEVESVASASSPAIERSNQFEEPKRGSSATIRRFRDQRRYRDDEPDADLLVTPRSDTDTEPD